jgi:transcription termination/antitermination protein NusG
VIENPHNSSPLSGEAVSEQPPAALPETQLTDSPPLAQAPEESHAAARETSPDDEAGETQANEEQATSDTQETVEAKSAPAAEEEERGPIEEISIVEEPPKMNWYILKVQSNREDSIRESLQRRVKVAGLDRFFGEIIVPIEMVSEFKGGKKRVVKRKLYPGYLVAHMEINEDTWFLVRETPGIGDFTGSAGKPTPMLPHEVAKIVAKQEEKADEAPKLKINFNVGDRVKINEGTFENFEGEVDGIEEASGRVTVMINIFGRSTPVELEYWQIETI